MLFEYLVGEGVCVDEKDLPLRPRGNGLLLHQRADVESCHVPLHLKTVDQLPHLDMREQ